MSSPALSRCAAVQSLARAQGRRRVSLAPLCLGACTRVLAAMGLHRLWLPSPPLLLGTLPSGSPLGSSPGVSLERVVQPGSQALLGSFLLPECREGQLPADLLSGLLAGT